MEEGGKEEIFRTQRLPTGESATKQARVDVEGDPVMNNPPEQPVRLAKSVTRRCPILIPQIMNSRKKKKSGKVKVPKKTVDQALGKRVEKYDLMNSFAQISAGIVLGQIAGGHIDTIRKDLQKVL